MPVLFRWSQGPMISRCPSRASAMPARALSSVNDRAVLAAKMSNQQLRVADAPAELAQRLGQRHLRGPRLDRVPGQGAAVGDPQLLVRDRKSTRLNSSHIT